MPILGPSEWRRLKLFAWFLLIINGCIAGIGVLFGRALESLHDALLIVGFAALLVNFAFILVVGGDVFWVTFSRWRRGPPSSPPE
jgi:uncharacterized membrane protein YfcA